MAVFFLALTLLVVGYFTYGKVVENVWGVSEMRRTPAVKCADGVDYVAMHPVKVFLVQFLNIAGLGPVFGAILGAVYGPVCLLWIVFGSIFAGGVHDFLSGMISTKFKGQTIVYVTEKLFGKWFKVIFLGFFLLLLFLLGAVFAVNPAKMLANLTSSPLKLWVAVVFGYYFLATLFPIDKIIGRFYPIFAMLLLGSTAALFVKLLTMGGTWYPNLTIQNLHPDNLPVFPMLFITVACGALSGFHATQSPLMARCLPNEKYGRPIFYGAMITEGVVALVWATLGIAYYQSSGSLLNAINDLGQGGVVSAISTGLLGKFGGVLTILSVVALSITSGDTAFRSIRLTISDFLKIKQKSVANRLILTTIVLGIGIWLGSMDLTLLWQYFGWANQTLAMLVLWTLSVYLKKRGKCYWITLIPAIFMTAVCVSYIMFCKIGFAQPLSISKYAGFAIAALFTIMFFATIKSRKFRKLKTKKY